MKINSHNHNTTLQMQNTVTSFLWIPVKYRCTVHISTHINVYIYICITKHSYHQSHIITYYNYIYIFSPNRCLLLSKTKNTCPFLGGFTNKTKIIEAKPPQPHPLPNIPPGKDRWRSPLPLVLVLSWSQIAKSPPFTWEWRSCAIDPFTRVYTSLKLTAKAPENGCLEYFTRFLLGPGTVTNFRCKFLLLVSGYRVLTF